MNNFKDARSILTGQGPEALLEAVKPESPPRPAPFAVLRADRIGGITETMDFVEGLLTEGGASVVYGPSNCGKSFWILDLGAHVASGKDWRHGDHEIEQGAVIYVALEGTVGATNRLLALRQKGILVEGAPLYVCFDKVSLLEAGHSARLAETITEVAKEADLPVKLVILDTMARAMAGGDENSGQDMTAAVQSIDAVRAATGAHVCVVHHCGKDEAKGARGHSSLRAAVDTEIEVFRPENETVSTVRVTKQRDLQIGEPMPFSLDIITLGTDRRDKPITSCVVRHEDEIMASERGKPGRKPAADVEDILGLLPADSTTAWQKEAKAELGISESTFHRLRRLVEGKRAFKRDDGKWFKMEVSK